MHWCCPHSTDEETEAWGGALDDLLKVSQLASGSLNAEHGFYMCSHIPHFALELQEPGFVVFMSKEVITPGQ